MPAAQRCPECNGAVDLAGIVLLPSGRLVSCGICGAIWRAFPPAEPPPEKPAPASEAATAAPPPETAATAPAARASGRGHPLAKPVWLRRTVVGVAAALAVGGGLLAARDYLAVWFPASRGVFAALGAPTRPSQVAVELVAIAPLEERTAFRVTYEVINETALSRPLPKVCVTGRDSEAERLFLRCFAGDAQAIPSRGARRFSFVATDLPAPLADLDLELATKPD